MMKSPSANLPPEDDPATVRVISGLMALLLGGCGIFILSDSLYYVQGWVMFLVGISCAHSAFTYRVNKETKACGSKQMNGGKIFLISLIFLLVPVLLWDARPEWLAPLALFLLVCIVVVGEVQKRFRQRSSRSGPNKANA